MSNLEGKVAVITSGSSGIGLATARRFVQEGTGSDLVTGKACIQRASDLLRGCRAADRPQVHGTGVLRGGLAPWLKKRVAVYVEDNISSNIRAADLAQIACLSLGHFFRAFRQSFGESPLMYVAKRRVCFAQTLMLSSRAPLCQIALDCGLSDQPHLTRVFRKIVGVPPARWRRQFTQETPPWVVTTHVEAMESRP